MSTSQQETNNMRVAWTHQRSAHKSQRPTNQPTNKQEHKNHSDKVELMLPSITIALSSVCFSLALL